MLSIGGGDIGGGACADSCDCGGGRIGGGSGSRWCAGDGGAVTFSCDVFFATVFPITGSQRGGLVLMVESLIRRSTVSFG